MDNKNSPFLYFKEETSLEDSNLQKKAKKHFDALKKIMINEMTAEVCYLYIDIIMYVILYYIQNMQNLLDEMQSVFCGSTKRYITTSTTTVSSSSFQAPPSPPYTLNTPSSKPFESTYNLRESTLLVCGIKRKVS